MYKRDNDLRPPSTHSLDCGDWRLFEASNLTRFYLKRCQQVLLVSSLLYVLGQGLFGQIAKAEPAETSTNNGWAVQSSKTDEQGAAQAQTAAPPELDLESAKESQKEAQKTQTKSSQANKEAPVQAQLPARPIIDLSPDLRESLESQFQQIQKLLETEDAFSESLGESYLSYGVLLQRAGRWDESREMLINALHISKVNNGVNSLEQRPVLRALFEMNLAQGNTEGLESNLRRIIWLEKKVPDLKDDYSFDMVVRTGNHFLDQYIRDPRVNDYNLNNLGKATTFFRLAVKRYGDRPLNEMFMPYGELAYSNFLHSILQTEVTRSYSESSRDLSLGNDFARRTQRRGSLGGSFSSSESYLKKYLNKAIEEKEIEHVAKAYLNLGDLNILFGRKTAATKYYEKAWDASQELPISHAIVGSFDQPQRLPAFNYSQFRDKEISRELPQGSKYENQIVPLIFDIDVDGSVKRIQNEAVDGTSGWSLSRAKRYARKLKFRPIIENGKLVQSVEHREDITIKVRSSQTAARKS